MSLESSSAVLRVALSILVAPAALFGVDFSTYRGFQLGADLPASAKVAGLQTSEAKTIHQRPALIQEMEWWPSSSIAKSDPLQQLLLRFYNGHLFQIVATYDRTRLAGMSEADMTSAISATYGTAVHPKGEIAYHSNYAEKAGVVARWESGDYLYDLVRTGDRRSFALVVGAKKMDDMAQAAIKEALRLDEVEAPQRAIDQGKKHDAEESLLLEKARAVNVPNFIP